MHQADRSVLAASQGAIRIDGLTKRFGKSVAVDDLSLVVPPGQTFGLLGPNGAGKSTTIRMMVGLTQPDEGTIEILGEAAAERTVAVKRRIGYVPEKHHIYPWMRVSEVLGFVSSLYPQWDDDLSDELLEVFELPRHKRVRHLSKGMVAKLGLLVALAPQPDVLLLDEPTSGLDPLIRDEFLEGILATQAQAKGRAVLFSSHHIDDVARIADVVGIMDGGRLILTEEVTHIHDRVKLMQAVIEDGTLPRSTPEEAIWTQVDRRQWSLTLYPFSQELAEQIAAENPVTRYEILDISLEDLFKQVIRGRRQVAREKRS